MFFQKSPVYLLLTLTRLIQQCIRNLHLCAAV